MMELRMNKKVLTLTAVCIIGSYVDLAHAHHNPSRYDSQGYKLSYTIAGSKNFYNFQSDLRKDQAVTKDIKNTKTTGLRGYLLYEDGKIVIDESVELPDFIKRNGNRLPSHSMGKSLVSYVTGHAICEGYIDSVDVKLDDWPTIKNTLYEGQSLIDLLNMTAGDENYTGARFSKSDNRIKINGIIKNVNTVPLYKVMKGATQLHTKRTTSWFSETPIYNYNALVTNTIMNYVIYKTGDDWEPLLHKVFTQHVKVKDEVHFLKVTERGLYSTQSNLPKTGLGTKELGRYSFYATRYDYLRIAKTMMDDWNNDTCAGKYLKAMYKQRIDKQHKKSVYGWARDNGYRTWYSKSYGGQFHFDLVGLTNRKILSMVGFAGQNIHIDFDAKRIIVINTSDNHINWRGYAHKHLKKK
jgi:CubicO group peptidase (beta-lactamase class C family)